MFQVLTQEESERSLLQRECKLNSGCYLVAASQMQQLIEMVRSITYEYFQSDLPVIAQKIRDLLIDALNMTCSLSLFRETMTLIRKQTEHLTFYQTYMINMNRQLCCEIPFETADIALDYVNEDIQAFEEAISNKSGVTDHTAGAQLQIQSRVVLKGDEITEKTMQSQIIQVSSTSLTNIYDSAITKLSQFLRNESYSPPNSDKKTQKTINNLSDSSFELKDFQKRRKNIMESNIEILIRNELQQDLTREMKQNKKEEKHGVLQQFRYKRQIKESLMNSKLKIRRKR